MGMISRRVVPRGVRRAVHPARTVKSAITPKPVKQVRRAMHPVDNAVYAAERSLNTKGSSGGSLNFWTILAGLVVGAVIVAFAAGALALYLVILLWFALTWLVRVTCWAPRRRRAFPRYNGWRAVMRTIPESSPLRRRRQGAAAAAEAPASTEQP
jgi:hypothetical protein